MRGASLLARTRYWVDRINEPVAGGRRLPKETPSQQKCLSGSPRTPRAGRADPRSQKVAGAGPRAGCGASAPLFLPSTAARILENDYTNTSFDSNKPEACQPTSRWLRLPSRVSGRGPTPPVFALKKNRPRTGVAAGCDPSGISTKRKHIRWCRSRHASMTFAQPPANWPANLRFAEQTRANHDLFLQNSTEPHPLIVPEERLKVARHFSAGKNITKRRVPSGTLENASVKVAVLGRIFSKNSLSKIRHPERRRANGSLYPITPTEPQSKDLAAISQQHPQRKPAAPRIATPTASANGTIGRFPTFLAKQTRSFDSGSADRFNKSELSRASAQDDGTFCCFATPHLATDLHKSSQIKLRHPERSASAPRLSPKIALLKIRYPEQTRANHDLSPQNSTEPHPLIVPEERLKVARHFSAGKNITKRRVPSGTLENFPTTSSTVPPGRDAHLSTIPGTEVPGYFPRSPRDPSPKPASRTSVLLAA